MNAPVKNTAPVAEGEEEENPQDDLKRAGNQARADLDEESSGAELFGQGLQAIGGATVLAYAEWKKVHNGIKDLNNPNFRYRILNVRDTTGFHQAHEALNNARGAVEKQRKSAQKKKNGKNSASWGFGKDRQEIKFADFDRREQAFQIGAAVQNHVTTEERFIRTKQAFDLDDVQTKKLRDGYATWKTQNKGKGIDEYIASTDAKNIYREQYNKQGKKLDGKTEKKGISYAYDSDDESRVEAIKASKDVIKKGQTEIKDVLDSKQVYTQEQIDQKIQTVTQAQTAAPTPTSTSTPAPATPVTPAAPVTPAPAPPFPSPPAPVPIPLPVTPSTPPIKPTFFSKHFPRISKTFNIVNSTINTVKEKIAAGIISALGKTVLKGAMNSALGLMVKSGIGAVLGVATGGLSVAVSVGWEVLKHLPVIGGLFNAIEGAAMGMVKGIAILVIAVPLIIIIFSVFQASKLMDQFVSGNQKIVYSPGYEQAENWKNFEKNYITFSTNPTLSWEELSNQMFTLLDNKNLGLNTVKD